MFTRRDYVFDKKCSHNEYYAQFVTDSVKQLVLSKWSVKTLKSAYAEDEHFNNLPLTAYPMG